jgi:hypothetical protein
VWIGIKACVFKFLADALILFFVDVLLTRHTVKSHSLLLNFQFIPRFLSLMGVPEAFVLFSKVRVTSVMEND